MSAATPTVPAAPGAPARTPGAPADWTEEGSFFQPRNAAFWLYVVLFGIGALFALDEQASYLETSTTAWVVGIVVLALFAVPIYLLINALDLFEREPRSLMLAAFLWGAVISTFLSAMLNTEWSEIIAKLFGSQFEIEWGAALTAPIWEELTKFLGIVVLILIARNEFDDVMDGFVFGALVGLGFTVAEDLYYFFRYFVGAPGLSDVGAVLEGSYVRLLVGGPYSHVLMTGLTGMGLAYFVTRPDVAKSKRILIATGLYLAGVAVHFIWNSQIFDDISDDFVRAAFKGLPFLALLIVLVLVARSRERRWISESLEPDVQTGLITREELETIGSTRRRRAARAAIRRRKGVDGERLLARLQHAQVALGLVASGSAPNREARLDAGRDLIRNLRAQLDALSDAGAAVPAAVGAAAGIPTGTVIPGTAGPAIAPPPAAAPAFAPTHRVPPEGLPAWVIPDPAGPATPVAGGLDLEVVQRVADWAQVRAVNGWTGWVDGRRLVPRTPPAA